MLGSFYHTTSGLSILLHGVISLPIATTYDKTNYKLCHPLPNVLKYIWLAMCKVYPYSGVIIRLFGPCIATPGGAILIFSS